jgi:hypothetical protein
MITARCTDDGLGGLNHSTKPSKHKTKPKQTATTAQRQTLALM